MKGRGVLKAACLSLSLSLSSLELQRKSSCVCPLVAQSRCPNQSSQHFLLSTRRQRFKSFIVKAIFVQHLSTWFRERLSKNDSGSWRTLKLLLPSCNNNNECLFKSVSPLRCFIWKFSSILLARQFTHYTGTFYAPSNVVWG